MPKFPEMLRKCHARRWLNMVETFRVRKNWVRVFNILIDNVKHTRAMKKISTVLLCSVLTALSLPAAVLFQDSSNYPYANGCIEGQGQWYCYSPRTPYLDALVTNNVLLLNTTNHDYVAAPTNGWTNPTEFSFASFTINVSQLPDSSNGDYFCQLQNLNGTNGECRVFIDTLGTVLPGTYRLGIANFDTSFANLTVPVNYPVDLATGITYTVVILYDNNEYSSLAGSTLWINPSEQDFESAYNDNAISPGIGEGYVYGLDIGAGFTPSQIAFQPYVNAGISNVTAGTAFLDVNMSNAPVIGIQPLSGTNYSGNSATFYTVASGVDLNYQWYSSSGPLSDGPNISGSATNILVVNNLSASDTYHVVVTDPYGKFAIGSNAVETVNTTPTAPFFPSTPAVNQTNNLFTTATLSDPALGTGPLFYQWFFAPTNAPNTFTPLAGQTSANLVLNLVDYSYQGNYYVVVSNAIAGGSVTNSPTISLTETAPLVASILQLHNLMISMTNQMIANESGTINVNTNNVAVGGYVTGFAGFGNSYSEFYMQDASGYGIEVYLYGFDDTNTPPVGTYVTVSGPVEIYHTELEIEPTTQSAIVTNAAPPVVIAPRLINADFGDLVTNGLGTNAILTGCSLVTLTNVYLYGTSSGGAFGTGGGNSGTNGVFATNSYSILYCTIGQYDAVTNYHYMEVYQFAYNYPFHGTTLIPTPIGGQPIPAYCSQLTGVYETYGGAPEILPSRLADYVTNPPSSFTVGVAQSKGVPTITWPPQVGSTYSVYSAPNLLGPWTQAAYGLAYYPTNGTFTDTNKAPAKFYRVSNP